MDTPQALVTMLGAGGGGAAILALINGVFKWLSGSTQRERNRQATLTAQRALAIAERDEAWDERDDADKKRREAEEHVSILKRQLLENGIKPNGRG